MSFTKRTVYVSDAVKKEQRKTGLNVRFALVKIQNHNEEEGKN